MFQVVYKMSRKDAKSQREKLIKIAEFLKFDIKKYANNRSARKRT